MYEKSLEQLLLISDKIKGAKSILLLTGAGISTSCGIPDFRGAGGLYENSVEKFQLPYPEALFDIDFFLKNPKPFYLFTKEFFSKEYTPSRFHKLISRWEKEKKSCLVVTQNIDGIHQKAGSNQVLPCHGDYSKVICLGNKKHPIDSEEFMKKAKKGEIPYCSHCGSLLKPEIVFFGESLPSSFLDFYQHPGDWDLFLAVGTSLSVEPAASFGGLMAQKSQFSVRLNNQITPYDRYFDICLNEELEAVALQLEKNLYESSEQ